MTFIFGVFNFQYFETYMISKLYKKLEKPEAQRLKRQNSSVNFDIVKDWKGKAKHNDKLLQPTKVSSIKLYIYECCNCLCLTKCLRKNRSEELFDKGMKNYEKEIDIIEMIRSFREIRIVLREFISRERQNFSIEKTSELGYLNSVMDAQSLVDESDLFSPTSGAVIKRDSEPPSANEIKQLAGQIQKSNILDF